MADIVDLRSRQPVNHADEFNTDLVQDLARYSEGGLVTEQEIRRRYQFDDSVWESLADNQKLLAAVADCQTQRVRSGANKREKSQVLVTKAPDVLSGILLDSSANAKHRIDSAKLLNDFSANGPTGVPASDLFQITINIGPETLTFSKPIKPDVELNHIDDTPQDEWLFPITTANKSEDNGGGEHI